MRHEGRVLTRAQLLENVWGWDYAGESQVVETYVSYLRRKLDPLGPPLIYTQRGVGYSFRPAAAVSGSRRLSLRARMLVLLIAVTTIFLLTMGTVSTVILARNVTAQFKSNLVTESSYAPVDVAGAPERLRGGRWSRGRRPDPESGPDHGPGDHHGAGRRGHRPDPARAAAAASPSCAGRCGRRRSSCGRRAVRGCWPWPGSSRPRPRAVPASWSWPSPPARPPGRCAGSSSPS